MTDRRMEWCQAGQNDSWNRLSICDWPRKTRLSGGCHIILVIKKSSWQVVMASHTSYERRWSKESRFNPMMLRPQWIVVDHIVCKLKINAEI